MTRARKKFVGKKAQTKKTRTPKAPATKRLAHGWQIDGSIPTVSAAYGADAQNFMR
jgi:hypothetical protein